MKVAYVVWCDAVSVDDWTEREEAETEYMHTIHSVGFVIRQDEERIILALNHDQNSDKVAQYIVIPRAWVKSYREIP